MAARGICADIRGDTVDLLGNGRELGEPPSVM
jgi:hypothetical protein